jgi:hypothetical protein
MGAAVIARDEAAPAVQSGGRSRDEDASLRSTESIRRGSNVPRGMHGLYACPRCHRVVDELLRVALANLVSFLEWEVCPACVRSLRSLAADAELVEVLG